jgi:myo-inositol-1(or 4)-monophosphatase
VAYKLAQVAAGLVDATWTLVPKNEWDVAAGVALVRAAGGHIEVLEDPDRAFNRENPLMAGMLAHPPSLDAVIRREINL